VTEEVLGEFEIHYVKILASVFIVPSSVNIVQYFFSCAYVIMAGTSRTREFHKMFEVSLQL
jgi:hypothetical protein